MEYYHIILNHMKNHSEFYKMVLVLISCLFCMLTASYVNLYLREDIVYTHFFYIPIILAAIWYGIKSLYLALLLGLFHVSLNYFAFGSITESSVNRALVFMLMTLLIYFITNLHRDRFTSFFLQPNYREESPRDLDCRTQQINMVGQLGVAVGHEIRNPLTTVRGFLQLMDDEADPQDLREYFSIMIEEIDKADAAISNLINLSENKTNYREEQDINDIIKECLNNNPPSGHGIKIKSRLHKIPKLQLDKLEIKELVLNLLTNAIESMPHGGTIVIVTKQVAHEVWFIIRDQGTGISKQTAQHIGTPFFSTKEKAHGLGLAICYSIAQRHGARIEFASSPKGTRFIVRFPLHTTSQTLAFDTKSSDLKAVSRLKQGSM